MCIDRAEEGIRVIERSRGVGDVSKRQGMHTVIHNYMVCIQGHRNPWYAYSDR